MANAEKLIPLYIDSQRMGSKAAQAARRKARAMREVVQILLSSPLVEEKDIEAAELLRRMGLEPDQQSAILLRIIQQAKAGDIRSAQFVRDLSGQGEKGSGGSGVGMDLKTLSIEELERMLVELE